MEINESLHEIYMDRINERRSYPSEIKATIHEHRAPTEKSIELLNDFEEKAKSRIIEQIHVKNSVIDAVAIYFINNFNDPYTRDYHLKFNINGKEYIIKSNVHDVSIFNLNETLHEAVAKSIAMELMKQLLPILKSASL